jgi:5'-deoxynucleotidase YfbR-like HD superfamily hydrolase
MHNGWIQTYTGRKFFPLAPRAEDVDVRDIAHALSLKCRFNGQCREFYSVAEHSMRVSRAIGPGLALWGLMHDAAEAYLADIGGPIKRAFHLHHGGIIETFDAAEDRLLGVIANALGFAPIDYEQVREADFTLLATEARDLLGPPPEPWNLAQMPLAEKILPLPPAQAEAAFLARFNELV